MYKDFIVQQILPLDFTRHVELEPYYVAKVHKKKAHQVNRMVKEEDYEFEFLKRVKPAEGDHVELLLCKVENESKYEEIMVKIKEYVQYVLTRDIPKWAPMTKEQQNEWNKHWPVNFHQNDFYMIQHSKAELDFLQEMVRYATMETIILFDFKRVILKITGKCKPKSVLHGIIELLYQWPESEQFKKEYSPYYLTNLNLFVGRKVCQMCAMALVHSRLKRLYYIHDNEEDIQNISYNKRLNHQYALLKINV